MSKIYKIPNGYRQNDDIMLPAYLKGYAHFFYANLDETITDTDFSNWVLSLFDSSGTNVATGVGTLTQDIISGSEFRFYAEFTIPNTVKNGVYELIVYNSVTTDVKYISNYIEVISDSEVDDYVLLFYRNSRNIFNYNYAGVTNHNTVFLPLNVVEEQPEIELKQYYEQTTGLLRNDKSRTSKVISIEGFYFDDEAHDMMLALSVHDDIRVNGGAMEVKTAYRIETNRINSVQKGVIELYDQEYSTINISGS